MKEYLNDPSKIPEEYIVKAYGYLKEYCDQKGVSVIEFVSDEKNIPGASAYIRKQLPFTIKMFFSEEKITSLLSNHLDFIQHKAKQYSKKRK